MNRLSLSCIGITLMFLFAATKEPQDNRPPQTPDSRKGSAISPDFQSAARRLHSSGFLIPAAAASPAPEAAPLQALLPESLLRRVDAAACAEPAVILTPQPGAQTRIAVESPCRGGEDFSIRYAGMEFIRHFDASGRAELVLDCLGGPNDMAMFTFQRAAPVIRPFLCQDLGQVTKIAVVWQGAVNLDLHAFEYAAGFGEPGHVWAGAPSSPAQAHEAAMKDRRGHGFMSMLDDGRGKGSHVEAYTFIHVATQTSGLISTAIDYETRARPRPDPESCGSGIFSEINYEIITHDRSAQISRSRGAFAPLACGAPLPAASRYNTKSSPRINAGRP